ncbi:MAG: terpene cyclase/mutase family protein [Planctomycetota bacterium]|nr:terpene cyclase/mutase family protein [Planctomycetota bacterium]
MSKASESGMQAPLEDLDDAPESAPPTAGFLDEVGQKFGGAPWWAISGSFHALLLLMLTLIGMAIIRNSEKDIIVTTSMVKDPIKEDPKIPKPDVKPVKMPVESEEPILQPTIVTHEISEAVEDLVNDQLNVDANDPKGDEGISDADTGRSGFTVCLGSGGGGSNRFGRPDSIGSMKSMASKRGGRETVDSVMLALEWLAKHQEPDGHWDCVKYGGKQADVAVTGLSLLAFLGAGHSEKVGQYKDNVKRAVYWLTSIQGDDGKYYKQGETHGIGYHHAIASLAMAEAAGMGRIAETIKSAQKGVDYSTEKHQQGEGSDKGGWRYGPKESPDLSVSGWFIMSLKSAKVAGLHVNPASFDGAIKFLDKVEEKGNAGDPYGGNRFGYMQPGHATRTTAIGNLCRQFMGWKRDDLRGGIEFFVNQGGVPQWNGNGASVDLYYWYYGTLSVYQLDAPHGDLWKRWNEAMKKALLDNQRKGGDENGSWDPVGAYSEYWGRVGQTALGALCLEVYYRYNLMLK